MEWAAYTAGLPTYPSIEHFDVWINNVARLVSRSMICMNDNTKEPSGQRNLTRSVLTVSNNDKQKNYPQSGQKYEQRCSGCLGQHHLTSCGTFKNKKVDERWAFVKDKKLCFSCLSKGHNTFQCRKKKVCSEQDCKKMHHPLLHVEPISQDNDVANINPTENVNTVQERGVEVKSTQILFKIIPVELKGKHNTIIKTYAMLDEGSSCSLINESMANMITDSKDHSPLTLQWLGGKQTEFESMVVETSIRANNSKRWLSFKARTVPRLELPKQTVNLNEIHQKYQQLKKLPLAQYTAAEPMILIGIDNCHLVAGIQSVQCGKSVVASRTPLGWVVYGQLDYNSRNPNAVFSVMCTHESRKENDETLNDIVTDYFTTENFGVSITSMQPEPKDVTRAKFILSNTVKRQGGRYESGLLWKNDDIRLPDSREMARSRFASVEKRMASDHVFAEAYRNAIAKMLTSNYARKLSDAEESEKTPLTWYLPHFAVFNANKPGKLRLVFDAAAKVNGISLNSTLLKGPDDMQPLIKVLLQFREGRVAVCADIKEMFLQVRIRERDQHSQRFLWRANSQEPIATYVMTSMIFGATCSPCIAQYVKNKNARIEAAGKPEVVSAIINNHYVDDFVMSFKNDEEALDVSQNVVRTHAKAGFELRGFICNIAKLQQQLNDNADQTQPVVILNTTTNIERVLGLYWDSRLDQLVFKTNFHKIDPLIISGGKCPTKRQFLSLVMSVYDPLGIVADILIYGKVLLQSLWRQGISWEDNIPTKTFERFKQWAKVLPQLSEIKLSRGYSPDNCLGSTRVRLHIFVDASEQAFAAVAYWQICAPAGNLVSFIMGKTRCAPLKILSIPRLELQAAVLGVRLKKIIIANHNVQPEKTILWSDSRTVLSWINSDHRQYKQFVAHRVGEILEETHENDWRWVPTKMNVADEATRTIYPLREMSHRKWNVGPEFLKRSDEEWPKGEVCSTTEAEIKRYVTAVIEPQDVIKINRFSNYSRFIRTIGWVLRYINNLRARKNETILEVKGNLTVIEINKAEIRFVNIVQNECYPDEKQQLAVGGSVPKGSAIYQLTPTLDKDGIIRVQGRTDYARVMEPSAKQPIILPHRHEFTRLMIKWYHERLYHQNVGLVVNEIRRKFWVPYLRSAVKTAQKDCQECSNRCAQAKPPLMGQLPKDRVTPYVRPFTYTGLDYFGPMKVTIGRRNEKRWAALFTCLTIRAVHIELAADLSTDACILCIRNFVNRRGVPVKIRSDMGTNFVGVNGVLQKTTDIFDMNYIQTVLSVQNIQWEFNCPANPSSGGCWERLIQSTKKVLAVTLKSKAPQVETLRSLLIEAENIVNSRPLTHLPVSPDEPDPLTPNHFLLGTLNSTQTPNSEHPECMATRKQFRICQQLKNHFWRRWVREYLPTLTKRTKWFDKQVPIKIGDVVVICEESLPRSEWQRGVVTDTVKAADGHIRIAEVKTTHGNLRRPVSRLAILDVMKLGTTSLTAG